MLAASSLSMNSTLAPPRHVDYPGGDVSFQSVMFIFITKYRSGLGLVGLDLFCDG